MFRSFTLKMVWIGLVRCEKWQQLTVLTLRFYFIVFYFYLLWTNNNKKETFTFKNENGCGQWPKHKCYTHFQVHSFYFYRLAVNICCTKSKIIFSVFVFFFLFFFDKFYIFTRWAYAFRCLDYANNVQSCWIMMSKMKKRIEEKKWSFYW